MFTPFTIIDFKNLCCRSLTSDTILYHFLTILSLDRPPGKRSAMYSVIRSFGLNGLNGFAVAVEADVSGGMPALSIVGLPDSAVRESGDRVHAAARNLGFKWPDRRITVNLAPADVRKTGPVYDLPLLPGRSSPRRKKPPFWGSWHWMAASARCPACCPWP